MHSNDVDDDDLEVPEREIDWSRAEVGGWWPTVKDPHDIRIAGASGYRLRLIPSNLTLATGTTTREVFARYLDERERGRPERTLVVDWCMPDGRTGKLAGGRILADIAQSSVHGAKTLPRNIKLAAELGMDLDDWPPRRKP